MMGYKVFNSDWTCRSKQYSCPGVFEQFGKLIPGEHGIHFCERLIDCFDYYDLNSDNHVAVVEALGDIEQNGKICCTNKIKIIKELSWNEVIKRINIQPSYNGKGNTGSCNIGNYNSGFGNNGNFNTGDVNFGDKNSGNYNEGNYNSGDFNNGNYNSGNSNNGNYNFGDWNINDYNMGCFNTTKSGLKFFNKPTDITMREWKQSEACRILDSMLPMIDAARMYGDNRFQVWWNCLSEEDKKTILNIPNFDAEIFKEITGIDVKQEG